MTMKHFNAFIFLFIVACMCLGGAGELSAQIPSIKRQTKPVKKKVADYDGVGKKIGEHEEVEIIEITEQLPPDMAAIAFYLKNNLPDKYKDKWPDASDQSEEQEQENMCLRDFTKAVARAVISENTKNG